MPVIGPIKRADLIYYLRRLGFTGPFSGGKNQLMLREQSRLILPNPHRGVISVQLLARLLREAGIERDEWERL